MRGTRALSERSAAKHSGEYAFEKADASYIRLVLVVVVVSMTGMPSVSAAWAAFLLSIMSTAVSTGTVTEQIASASTPDGMAALDMVFDELLDTWAMLSLRRWPLAEFLCGYVGEAESSAELATAHDDDDAVADEAGCEASALDQVTETMVHSRHPVAVINMAGPALS